MIKPNCLFIFLFFNLSPINNAAYHGSSLEKSGEIKTSSIYSIFVSPQTKLHEIEQNVTAANRRENELFFNYFNCSTKGILAFRNYTRIKVPTKHDCAKIDNFQPHFDNHKTACGYGMPKTNFTPWVVAVLRKNKHNNESYYLCSGTIINPRAILVSLSCFRSIATKNLFIKASPEQSLASTDVNRQNRYVLETKIQTLQWAHNEILQAILILSEPLLFSRTIHSICLPDEDYSYSKTDCYVLGWTQGLKEKLLMRTKVNLTQCTEYIGQRGEPIENDFFVCISGYESKRLPNMNQKTTQLVCPSITNPNQYFNVGIGHFTSSSNKNQTTQGYFLSVLNSRYWIDKTIIEFGLDRTYYMKQ